MLPDTPVSLSSEVLPELMEYERTITTVANSYIKPQVSRYLSNLLNSLKGKTKHLRVLRSDGGLSSISLANQFPVILALSGPAGGVSGVASLVAAKTAYRNLITLDMGGTSTDVALIENGAPRIRRETAIGDLIVKAPSVDVRTVGAGGGSIASVPEITKALRVGPQSSGADPGPACYGKGGHKATVTDANAVLGYLPEYILGGAFKLDLKAAHASIQSIADDLDISVYQAAEGILKVANETMYGALRLVSVEQGFDPRDFSLVAFGGAGPLHANALGKLLHAFPVIIPPSPGVLCAWGDATTILRHEVSATFIRVLANTSKEEILDAYHDLATKATQVMREEQGVPEDKQVILPNIYLKVYSSRNPAYVDNYSPQNFKYQADLRYIGQAITIPIDVEISKLKDGALSHISELFEVAHEKAFTYRLSANIELMNLRIVAEEITPEITVKRIETTKSSEPPSLAIVGKTTLVYQEQEFKESIIWNRSELKYGNVLYGPCIVNEMDSNTLILPGFKGEIDSVGNILLWESDSTNGVNTTSNGSTNGTEETEFTLDMVTGQ